jgi:hypothetical protein
MALKEGIPVTEFSMPGMFGASSDPSKIYDKYSVKYKKVDLDDPADLLELQQIETRGLRGQDIVILKKDNFVFMSQFFIVIQYLELNEASTSSN